MFKNGNFVRTILGILFIAPALYLICWCIENPGLTESSYLVMAFIGILIGGIILFWTYHDAQKIKEAEQEETPDEEPEKTDEAPEEEYRYHEKTPEEIAAERGIDLSRVPYKSKALALFLCLFGIIGLHRLYIGKLKSGLAMMLVSLFLWWTYIALVVLFVITVFDVFYIVGGEMRDSYNRPLV